MNADTLDALANVLKNEDGLASDASCSVLVTVLATLKSTDEKWREKGLPGNPSVTNYAANVIEVLERQYGGIL